MAREHGVSKEMTDAVQSVVMAVFACGVNQRSEIGNLVPERQKAAFSAFFKSAQQNEMLGSRTTTMIQLAAAFVNGCPT